MLRVRPNGHTEHSCTPPSALTEAHSSQLLLSTLVVRRAELIRQLDISERTFSRLEAQGLGPKRIRLNRLILYSVESIREWLKERESSQPSHGRARRNVRIRL
jgi:predicted DNA-binding transcriptional regulator AlpA